MDSIVVAEFRGLFWGEGSVLITRKRLKGRGLWTYVPALTMDMYNDEREILKAVALHIGGHFGGPYKISGANDSFRYRWRVDGFTQTPPIARLLLDGAVLPHPKIEQLGLLLEFCNYRLSFRHSYLGRKVKAKLAEYFERMKALRC